MRKITHLLLIASATTCLATATLAQAEGAGPATTSAPEDDAAARTVMEINCSGCHELSEVTSRRKDLAGWTETVQKMVDYGAPVGQRDQQRIIAYLARNYQPAQ